MTDDSLYELLITLEMKYQHLGANLVDFLNEGFDPDSCYTPCEIALYDVYEYLGFDRHDILREAHRRLIEEADE